MAAARIAARDNQRQSRGITESARAELTAESIALQRHGLVARRADGRQIQSGRAAHVSAALMAAVENAIGSGTLPAGSLGS